MPGIGVERSIMRVVDLIEKKKKGLEHSKEEIEFLINSMMDGSAEDYQISAWLMAVYFKGMTSEETAILTECMINSGERINLSSIGSHIADKHSTGGVGDKITIILIPLLAACGVPVAKLSGKGLGHTGGTIDKLEAIPGFRTALEIDELIEKVKTCGVAIGSQTKKLTPADGKLYALRDVTATVDSMPLIASSVVSKKIASGADFVVLDVKYGSGAFIKTPQKALELSELMVDTAGKLGKKFNAIISSMEQPLGRMVGNSLEVIESIEFLKGNMTPDIEDLTFKIAALTLVHLNIAQSEEDALNILKTSISDGSALEKFKELIISQDGNPNVLDDYSLFKQPGEQFELKAPRDGFIKNVDAYKTAYACKLLGAGRDKKSDDIDYSAGIMLNKIYGEKIIKDDVIAILYSDSVEKIKSAVDIALDAFEFSDSEPEKREMIYKVI